MNIPKWLATILQNFGESIGLKQFELAKNGVASITFESAVQFRIELVQNELLFTFSVPFQGGIEEFKRLLTYAHPKLSHDFSLHTTYSPHTHSGLFISGLTTDSLTLPTMNARFQALWNLAEDFRSRKQ